MSLIGSLTSQPLAFFLPPMFAYRYARTDFERTKLVSLMSLSCVLWVTGVSGSVMGVAEDWRALGGAPFDCACEAEQCASNSHR